MKIPLHHNAHLTQKTPSGRAKARKRQLLERFTLWQTMNEMNPNGFRQPPSSRKNPMFHKNGPVTRLERMAHELT